MKRCPACNGPLREVPRHNPWLNDDQYAAVKAGDWCCDRCPSNHRSLLPGCYWKDHEIEEVEHKQCEEICRV